MAKTREDIFEEIENYNRLIEVHKLLITIF